MQRKADGRRFLFNILPKLVRNTRKRTGHPSEVDSGRFFPIYLVAAIPESFSRYGDESHAYDIWFEHLPERSSYLENKERQRKQGWEDGNNN